MVKVTLMELQALVTDHFNKIRIPLDSSNLGLLLLLLLLQWLVEHITCILERVWNAASGGACCKPTSKRTASKHPSKTRCACSS